MLTPRTIKTQLSGTKFTIRREGSDESVLFEFPENFTDWPPRRGAEGIVAPLVCHHPTKGKIPSIIKFFNFPSSVRATRQSQLVRYGLSGVHDWLYEGVPYAWVDKLVGAHRIFGHVTKHVMYSSRGDDFRIVRDQDFVDEFTEDQRRAMGGQLCNAIVGLERLSIVHGDLSPANIIIGKTYDDESRCILIDYDGFSAPNVPMLPRQFHGQQLRMMGSPGYQHPSLMQRIAEDDGLNENLYVRSDRFALGVLCFELMVWTTQISNSLNRTNLLNDEALKERKLEVPKTVLGVWPEGEHLLREMVSEPDEASLPSPEDWLKALGFLGGTWSGKKADWASTAFLKIFHHPPNSSLRRKQLVHFENESGSGDLSVVDNKLGKVNFRYKNDSNHCLEFILSFSGKENVSLRRNGVTRALEKGVMHDVWPGDVFSINSWKLEFQDASLGTSW